jgi:hypothetical protein
MKIWIYYHIAQFPGWEQLVDEKIQLMKQHGLWQRADKIVLQLHYDPDAALRWMLKDPELCRDPRITVLRHIEVFGIIGIFPTQKPLGEVLLEADNLLKPSVHGEYLEYEEDDNAEPASDDGSDGAS